MTGDPFDGVIPVNAQRQGATVTDQFGERVCPSIRVVGYCGNLLGAEDALGPIELGAPCDYQTGFRPMSGGEEARWLRNFLRGSRSRAKKRAAVARVRRRETERARAADFGLAHDLVTSFDGVAVEGPQHRGTAPLP